MKTLKLSPAVHTELKTYVAQRPSENMTDVAGLAIMKYLSEQGHKFVFTRKSKSSKSIKK